MPACLLLLLLRRYLSHHGGQTATSNMPLVADCFGKARICTKILLAPSSKFKHLRSKAECYDRRSLRVHFLLLLHELPLFGTHLHYFFPTSRKQAFDGPSPQFIQRVRVADKPSALCWLGGAMEMLSSFTASFFFPRVIMNNALC